MTAKAAGSASEAEAREGTTGHLVCPYYDRPDCGANPNLGTFPSALPFSEVPPYIDNDAGRLSSEMTSDSKIQESDRQVAAGRVTTSEPPRWGWQVGEGSWSWGLELHGDPEDLIELPALNAELGVSTPKGQWTFVDAFAGIGNASVGFELAGGVCVGAFEKCANARRLFQRRTNVAPLGSWGSFKPSDLPKADVLFSSPPCEAKHDKANEARLMWRQLDLVREHQYQVVVIEHLLHFKQLEDGKVYHEFVAELQRCGYVTFGKLLNAPDFGSAANRKRLYLVALRQDVATRTGDFRFPRGSPVHHPVWSILEPEFFRKGVRVGNTNYVEFEEPVQHDDSCLRQLGEMKGEGPGRSVYDVKGMASTQTATGVGPGWTSGLYVINGSVSRLTVTETARLMQIDDHVEFDGGESLARRQLGNTLPIGVARALGVQVEAIVGRHQAPGKQRNPSLARPLALTAAGRNAASCRHNAKVTMWQAMGALREAASSVLDLVDAPLRYAQLTPSDKKAMASGVHTLEAKMWVRCQRRRGVYEIRKLQEAGVDKKTIRRAQLTIDKAMMLEWHRGGDEESPINLLWWRWKGPVAAELLEGYRLPLRTQPRPVFPDNYDSADVEAVWNEFTRMKARGYIEGPFEREEGQVYMSHPLAAVAKKGTSKVRIVVDLSVTGINACMIAQRYIMPQPSDVAAKCYKGAWMITADLADGFYGVEVHGPDRKYLGLKHPTTGLYYRYTRLSMGASCSPAAFTRLVAWAVKEANTYPEFKPTRMVVNDHDVHMPRVYGVNAEGEPVATSSWFVDDGCIVAPSKSSCVKAYKRLVWLLESVLGWRIKTIKTVGPLQRINFCGLELDSVGQGVGGPCTRLSEDRRDKLIQAVDEFTAKYAWKRKAPRRAMASLVGQLSFAANAIPSGRCFLARMYRALHECDEERKGDPADYDRWVVFGADARLDMQWWALCLQEADCVRLWRSGSFALHRCWSDASNYGFAHCIATNEEANLPTMAFSHGVWPDTVSAFSSNYHELATILHSIKSQMEKLRGSMVHFFTDNTTAVKAVNSGVVRSPQLMKLSRELKLVQAKGNIGVEAIHLSGKIMQVHGTDQASRSAPWHGMYSGTGGCHDLFSPLDWPRFSLGAELDTVLEEFVTARTLQCHDPAEWFPHQELAGRDSYAHLRPCHAGYHLERVLEAHLRLPHTTSATVVVPMVGLRSWAKFLKHFRRKEVHVVQVEGLGEVKHWLLRMEEGDSLLPRGEEGVQEVLRRIWKESDGEHGTEM